MKLRSLCIFFILLFHLTYAQLPGIDVIKKESQIKRTMTSQPDSARFYIKQILNYKGRLHDTVYSNAYMAYGYCCHLKNITDSALFYYDRSATFLNEVKYPKLYARLLRNKASTYKKRGNYNEALKNLSIAEKLHKSVNDEIGVALVYGDIASNYNILLRSEEAIQYMLKAIEILERKKDTFYILPIKLSLANAYLNSGNLDFAADLYREILKSYKERNIIKNYAITLLNYGDCLNRMGKYNDAKQAFNESIVNLEKFNDQELIGVVYSKLAKMEFEKNNLPKAEELFNYAFKKVIANNSLRTVFIGAEYMELLNLQKKYTEASKLIPLIEKPILLEKANLSEKAFFESQKAITYQNLNHEDKALVSIENSLKLKDTLNKSDNELVALTLQNEYQTKYQQSKEKALKQKNTVLKKTLFDNKKNKLIPLICCILILIGFAFILFLRNKRCHKALVFAKEKKESLLQEYENTKNLNKVNKENLEIKKKELFSGMLTLATLEGNISRLVALCSESPADMHIEEVKDQLRSLTSDDDYWNLFRKRFNEAYENFQKNLQSNFPALTKNDLFFCSLLKLNLPYKDMAMLMQVTPESIVKKKYRVKKKMGIETESELENILLNTPL
ncbi:tetratricopeptide repeat protein [Flavobacterium sp. NRK1]|uniref:tetratricopeptide repeat protein n=1 Tax=Flavobacterium sp. NRK1 TaxID=2954929 RepID=UPI0020934DF8|nr:tetratricopeptide repeat protein [Flavobacterium sp. NRK1]MCO6148141.1 tetratricopeptide repeat protein [Flavobacterium sp. NRK1]